MNAKLLAVVALLAVAVVAVSATTAGESVAVERGRVVAAATTASADPKKRAPKAAAKGKVAAAKGGKANAKAKAKSKSRVRRTVRKSPIKGKTPATIKGKKPDEKGSAKTPQKPSASNAGMGAVGAASRPKPAAQKEKPVKGKAASKGTAKAKAKATKGKPQPKKQAKAKPPKAKGLMKFRALEAADAEAEADAEVAAEAEAAAAVAVGADSYPMKVAGGYKLSAKLQITDAALEQLKTMLPKLGADKVFWHWDGFQACTRWTRSGMSEGEMKFFDSQSGNMYSGGGLYMAEGFENSADYGMFPCRIVVKADSLRYDDGVMRSAVAKAIIPKVPDTEEKVALGQLIPFVHQYAVSATQRPPYADWWVTHSHLVFKEFSGGNFPLGDGTQVVPHFTNNARGGNGNGQFAVNIQSSLDLYKYWNQLMDVEKLEPALDVPAARNDLREGLRWLKSFTFLFSYIDGASLFRALGVSPNDPFDVFEKQRFPNFQNVYEKYINARLASTQPSLWGWSAKGTFGNGKDTAAVWAKNALDNLLPGLYKELSQGGVMRFRDSEVRAGGDEEGRTFVATSGQVEVMKQNPYLLTVDSPARADGSILVYYYYPCALYRNPALKSRVSPALWNAMEEDVQLAVADPNFKQSDRYKQHTVQLMNELILEAFTRLHGKSAEMDKGGLQIMLDLVSIHPCTDFNGRTTRFVGVVSALESSFEPPIAFMSDFDLTTPVALYGKFLKTGTEAYFKLKLALTAELLTGVCNGKMPNHYGVSYWAKLASDALSPFSGGKPVTYDDSDWDTIRARRFVPLMDKKLGTAWTSRNGKAGTPMVQKPGELPPRAPPTAAPANPTAPPAPKLSPNDCANGKGSCSTCTRLNGKDNYGCGFHKTTKECHGVYVVNNNNRDYVLLRDDCPPRSG